MPHKTCSRKSPETQLRFQVGIYSACAAGLLLVRIVRLGGAGLLVMPEHLYGGRMHYNPLVLRQLCNVCLLQQWSGDVPRENCCVAADHV